MASSGLSEAEASERLQWLETKYDLLQHKVGGWCVWPLVRLQVAKSLQRISWDPGERGFSRKDVWQGALRDAPRLARPGRARFVAKTFSSVHTEFEGGRRKDIFFDDLLKRLGSSFKIETFNNRAFLNDGVEYVRPRDISTFAIDVIAWQLARRTSRASRSAAAQIHEAVERGLGVKLLDIAALTKAFERFALSKRIYAQLFRRLRASHLLVVDQGEYAATAGALESGMEVVEFQHGYVDRHYPGDSWTASASLFRSSMPVPNRIFVYGPHWADALRTNGFWRGEELVPVGSARLDAYRTLLARPANPCTLVLTTQGFETAAIIRFLKEFLVELPQPFPLELYVKMHPGFHTDSAAYEAAFREDARIKLVAGRAPPSTFELLARAHLHLSVHSFCHYEALALGTPTVILPVPGHEVALPLHASGAALLPSSPKSLAETVVSFRELSVPPHVAERYFVAGALDNTVRQLLGPGARPQAAAP